MGWGRKRQESRVLATLDRRTELSRRAKHPILLSSVTGHTTLHSLPSGLGVSLSPFLWCRVGEPKPFPQTWKPIVQSTLEPGCSAQPTSHLCAQDPQDDVTARCLHGEKHRRTLHLAPQTRERPAGEQTCHYFPSSPLGMPVSSKFSVPW